MKFKEGERVVVKFHDGTVMGYFLSYYNDDYACVVPDDSLDGNLLTERRRVSRAAAVAAVANIQIFEATVSMHREALEDHAPPPTKQGGLSG